MLLISLGVAAYGEDKPNAILKAEYESYEVTSKGTEKEKTSVHTFILQIAPGTSYWYDPQTYFTDSLENDPSGNVMLQRIKDEVWQQTSTYRDYLDKLRALGYLSGERLKLQKFFDKGSITVWNYDSPDYYRYDVLMDELAWELQDSTTNIMGYECCLATADYHGKRWSAWFTPEVPVQDGPWQLCGLPGLILKADTDDGNFGFIAKGLQECNEQFKEKYIPENKLFLSKRKAFWKTKDYGRRNRRARISAMSNGAVNLKNADYKGTDDFIECDYHD